MSGCLEFGKCDICGVLGPVKRTYFHFETGELDCDCCSGKHCELILHCRSCEPKKPSYTKISISTNKLKEV